MNTKEQFYGINELHTLQYDMEEGRMFLGVNAKGLKKKGTDELVLIFDESMIEQAYHYMKYRQAEINTTFDCLDGL